MCTRRNVANITWHRLLPLGLAQPDTYPRKIDAATERLNSLGERYFKALCGCCSL